MTYQVRETLVYRGQRRAIRALPLHNCERPVPDFHGLSSGCWRGYQGTWEVRDDVLHLVRLGSPAPFGDDRDRLTEMFPEASGSVEATWFSGEIVSGGVTDPKDGSLIETYRLNNRPVHFLHFTLVVHRGHLLAEVTTDLRTGVTQSRLTRHIDGLFPAEERAFLHAVNANLEDFTARLVYADWLEERDDPRAPLLRLEVARQQKEGPTRTAASAGRQDIPTGFVPPDDLHWYWCRLADIPEPTPEEREYRELLAKLRGSG